MRGSPLFRTLIVLILLTLAGLVLARLTRPVAIARPASTERPPASSAALEAAYRLTLSAEASAIRLESADAAHHTAEGRLRLDASHPTVLLEISWRETSPSHRFAKLTLDLPGKPTLSHVFEAPGDIQDVWEIDLP